MSSHGGHPALNVGYFLCRCCGICSRDIGVYSHEFFSVRGPDRCRLRLVRAQCSTLICGPRHSPRYIRHSANFHGKPFRGKHAQDRAREFIRTTRVAQFGFKFPGTRTKDVKDVRFSRKSIFVPDVETICISRKIVCLRTEYGTQNLQLQRPPSGIDLFPPNLQQRDVSEHSIGSDRNEERYRVNLPWAPRPLRPPLTPGLSVSA